MACGRTDEFYRLVQFGLRLQESERVPAAIPGEICVGIRAIAVFSTGSHEISCASELVLNQS